jgi:hypothetical protein
MQQCFAWKAPLACRCSSSLAASSDCLARLFVALGTVRFACTGHSRAITGQKVAPINLVEPAAHQIAVAELYRRHRFAKRQLKTHTGRFAALALRVN